MKRVGYLIDKIADLDNLYLAYTKACRGKRTKREVIEFGRNLNANLRKMSDQIRSGEVEVGNYTYFTIYDPKQRIICAAAFGERVLHHAIMNICHPYFERVLIADTYATRPNKGVYSAIDKARRAVTNYRYVAKLDVRKYFDSIRHSVLKTQLRRMFKDRVLLTIFDKIIDSYSVSDDRGLPIGNLTSQYLANHYLANMDHMIKEQLRVPIYTRYMDDMLLFADDRAKLKEWVSDVQSIVGDIGLSLKEPIIAPTYRGVAFLGYKLLPHHILLARRSKMRFVRKMVDYTHRLNRGEWCQKQFAEHVIPLTAFVLKASSRLFRVSVNRRVAIEGRL